MRKSVLSAIFTLSSVVIWLILPTQVLAQHIYERSRNTVPVPELSVPELCVPELCVPELCVRRALLISTGKSEKGKFRVLKGVDNDVDLICDRLLDKRLGFQEENIVVLKTEDKPTKEKIEKAVDNFLDTCGPNDFIIIYFSGHGFNDVETNVDYYVAYDAKPIIDEKGDVKSAVGDTCFSLDKLNKKVGVCRARFKWVIIDACRVNAVARNGFEDGLNPIQDLQAPKGSLLYQSCKNGQESLEYSRRETGVWHGRFTWFLCEGLKGKARNREGRITAFGLFKYVHKSVSEESQGEQTPIMQLSNDGDPIDDFIIGEGFGEPISGITEIDKPISVSQEIGVSVDKPYGTTIGSSPETMTWSLVNIFSTVGAVVISLFLCLFLVKLFQNKPSIQDRTKGTAEQGSWIPVETLPDKKVVPVGDNGIPDVTFSFSGDRVWYSLRGQNVLRLNIRWPLDIYRCRLIIRRDRYAENSSEEGNLYMLEYARRTGNGVGDMQTIDVDLNGILAFPLYFRIFSETIGKNQDRAFSLGKNRHSGFCIKSDAQIRGRENV